MCRTAPFSVVEGLKQGEDALSIGCHNFDIVDEFTQLDVLIRFDGDTKTEIRRRIMHYCWIMHDGKWMLFRTDQTLVL